MKPSRRQFLKYTFGTVTALSIARLPLIAQDDSDEAISTETPEAPTLRPVAVPPSIMLHARWRHEQMLPDIIDRLQSDGYDGITYKDLIAYSQGEGELPEKPVIISFDDLSMARGIPSYEMQMRMAAICQEKNFRCVFGVNTHPQTEQVDAYWETVREWVESGAGELATHTATHMNLARYDLTRPQMEAEVIGSAQMIEERTGQAVSTLILPFGNGYDFTTGEMLPSLIETCQAGGIQIVVGIAGGRGERLIGVDDVVLMGRVPPGAQTNESVEATLWEVRNW